MKEIKIINCLRNILYYYSVKVPAIIIIVLYAVSILSYGFVVKQNKEQVATKSSCCSKMKSHCTMASKKNDSEKKQSSGCMDCVSVLACPLCLYILGDGPSIFSPIINVAEITRSIREQSLSSFSGECWHPPE